MAPLFESAGLRTITPLTTNDENANPLIQNVPKKKSTIDDLDYGKQPENLTDEAKISDIAWPMVGLFGFIHLGAIYALYLTATGAAKWQTVVLVYVLSVINSMGLTGGAHRLWSHRSFTASLPLRLFLAFQQTCTFQLTIIEWVRDHRVHHKFAETNADPQNSRRGFFYAHVGWMLLKPHPDSLEARSRVDITDLMADPVVRIQAKYYSPIALLLLAFMVSLPVWLFGENLWAAFWLCGALRVFYMMQMAFSINSFAHMYGMRPYSKEIAPVENRIMAYLTMGEGYHNYHHTFPWDYSTSELGANSRFNATTMFIDFCVRLGLASGRKKPSAALVQRRIERTGEPLVERDAQKKLTKGQVLLDYILGWAWVSAVFLAPLAIRAVIGLFGGNNSPLQRIN